MSLSPAKERILKIDSFFIRFEIKDNSYAKRKKETSYIHSRIRRFDKLLRGLKLFMTLVIGHSSPIFIYL
tara:strand:+ start:391 stop:600 length:210 start_codon:yes stop_codon:yes gene_type:complete